MGNASMLLVFCLNSELQCWSFSRFYLKNIKRKKGKDLKIIRIINHYFELDSSNSQGRLKN